MPDIIKLLPDNVANQIAAGEVVQRPASIVKELLENSIDAGADKITLVVQDSGKELIQVIDNGKGMSETDARMAFERHATSKISTAQDIFKIQSKGFRGEALASISAVAQVKLKTKNADSEIGIELQVSGNKVDKQEYTNCAKGCQIEVRNLFYNIPARRNFLKSNSVELRHIIDEFERVAIPHPDIHFSFINNGSELFDLPAGGLRQRIVHIFGAKYNEKLVPVDEDTPILKLHGFIVKPEFSKKTRGEQFFFTNNRFIKNAYLHRAVMNAFDQLLADGFHPSYYLFMEIDPAKIDVNIHPTKTEIKFDDDKAIHTYIRTAVKHALGQYNISPTIDFSLDQQYTNLDFTTNKKPVEPGITINPNYNPFESNSNKPLQSKIHGELGTRSSFDWTEIEERTSKLDQMDQASLDINHAEASKSYLQIGKKYIATKHLDGLILVHQQRAHEKVQFQKFIKSIEDQSIPSQQLLFPQNHSFDAKDFKIIEELIPELRNLGFDLDFLGKTELIVHGIPLYLKLESLEEALDILIEVEKEEGAKADDHSLILAKAISEVSSIRSGQSLNQDEMAALIDELFACEEPSIGHNGKAIIVNQHITELDKYFN